MTGTTEVAGVTVNCECLFIRELRIGPKIVKAIYSVLFPTGQIFFVDNFTEDNT